MFKVALFANTDWYLYNFRLSLAKALRERGVEVLLLSPRGPYVSLLEQEGFSWVEVPVHRRSLNPLKECAVVLRLWRLIRLERIGLLHSFTVKCAIYGALASRLSWRLANRSPNVSAVVGLGYVFGSSQLRARVLRPFVRLALRIALGGRKTRLVLQNSDDREMFVSAGIVDESRVRLIRGSGVDVARFHPANPALANSMPTRPFRVLMACRLLWDKGLSDFVDAARLMGDQAGRIEFLLAGAPDEGNPDAVDPAALTALGQEGVVKWLGHVDDMPHLYRQVDLVVLPTCYREGLPKVLIEAAACGLPLIASDIPGCREVITDGVDGLLVPMHDAKALAVAINRLMQDSALRASLAAAAKLKAEQRFDERLIIAQTLAVYDEYSQAGFPLIGRLSADLN